MTERHAASLGEKAHSDTTQRGAAAGRDHVYLDEVFLSIQGEGVWVGERQAFVRFSGCGLDCAYCDSQRARRLASACAYRTARGDTVFEANPVHGERLTAMVMSLADPRSIHSLSVTGGEPLLQHAFLQRWLPEIRGRGYRIYLETAGTLPERLETVIGCVDFCAMDIKLPSATGLRSYMDEHRRFLNVCRQAGVPTEAKAVVSALTSTAEIETTARMIAQTWDEAALILQPVTPAERMLNPPTFEQLMALQGAALRYLRSVRVIPQTHKLAGVP